VTVGPIVHERTVRVLPEAAFDAWARRIGEWWHPDYTPNAATYRDATIEPCMGGRVFFRHDDLGEVDWGRVTRWEPGRALAHDSWLAQDAAHPSLVSVTFVPHPDGCAIRFAHGGWTDANGSYRRKFGDWELIIDRYAALAEGRE
jgi:hypothetical protein